MNGAVRRRRRRRRSRERVTQAQRQRLVLVLAREHAGLQSRGADGSEVDIRTAEPTIGQVDVKAVGRTPGQTSDQLPGEGGVFIVDRQVLDRRVGASRSGDRAGHIRELAERFDGDVVDTHASADERIDRRAGHEVVDQVTHQGPRRDLTVGGAALGARTAQNAGGAEAQDGVAGAATDRLDVARTVAALEFNPPVRRQLITEAREARPIIFLVEVPVVGLAVDGVGRRARLEAFRPVVAEVDSAVPAGVLRGCA